MKNEEPPKLQCRVLTSYEKVFCSPCLTPEIPLTDGMIHAFDGARGENIAFQLAFKFPSSSIQMTIRLESELAEHVTLREVAHVPCELPAVATDEFVLRRDPGLYPDPLIPLSGPLHLAENLWQAVWVGVRIPADFNPGIYDMKFHFDMYQKDFPWQQRDFHEEAVVRVHVHPAVLPEQKMICTNWFYADCLSAYYHEEPWSERFWEILENYFRDLAAHGLNMLMTPLWSVPLDTAIGHERPSCQLLGIKYDGGRYSFDFSLLKRWLDLGRKCKVEYFEMSHFFTQWGAKATPKIMVEENGELKRRFGWDVSSESPEYREFLFALLPELLDFLRGEGLSGKCYFHYSDEPFLEMIEEYRHASEPLRNYLGTDEFPVMDALSDVEFYKQGLVSRPVPCLCKIETFGKETIPHRWCYFAGADKNYPVRSLGAPSCRCRILGVLLYLYEMEGFLHWGHNFWFTQYLLECNLDPWRDTTAGRAFCGGHIYNVYPGRDGKPVDAIHYEVFMEAMQDVRLLQLLESRIGRAKTVDLICEGLNYRPAMNHFPHEAVWLRDLRNRIFAALE